MKFAQTSLALFTVFVVFIFYSAESVDAACSGMCSAGSSLCQTACLCCPSSTYCGTDANAAFGAGNLCYEKPMWHLLLYVTGDNDIAGYGYKEAQKIYGKKFGPSVAVTIMIDWDPDILKRQTGVDKTKVSHHWEVWGTTPSGGWKTFYFDSDNVDTTSSNQLTWFMNYAEWQIPSAQHRILVMYDHAGPLSYGVDFAQCQTRRRDISGADSVASLLTPGYNSRLDFQPIKASKHSQTRSSQSLRDCSDLTPLTARDIVNAIKRSAIPKIDILGIAGCNWNTMTNVLWFSQVSDYSIGSETYLWLGASDTATSQIVSQIGWDYSVFSDSALTSMSVNDVATKIASRTRDLNSPNKFNIAVIYLSETRLSALKSALKVELAKKPITASGAAAARRSTQVFAEHYPSGATVDLADWGNKYFGVGNSFSAAVKSLVSYHAWTGLPNGGKTIFGLAEYYPPKDYVQWSLFEYISGLTNTDWYNVIRSAYGETQYVRPKYSTDYPTTTNNKRDVLDGGYALSIDFAAGADSVQRPLLYAGLPASDGTISLNSRYIGTIQGATFDVFWSADVYYLSFKSSNSFVELYYTDDSTTASETGYFDIEIPFLVDLTTYVLWQLHVQIQPIGVPDKIVGEKFVSFDLVSGLAAEYIPESGSKWYPIFPTWDDVHDPETNFFYYEGYFLTLQPGDTFLLSGLDVQNPDFISENPRANEIRLKVTSVTFANEIIFSELIYNAITGVFTSGIKANVIANDQKAAGLPDFEIHVPREDPAPVVSETENQAASVPSTDVPQTSNPTESESQSGSGILLPCFFSIALLIFICLLG